MKKNNVSSYEKIFRRGILIDEVRVEDVEFVALHDLRRRIVHIIVRLIVFIPLETSVHAVKVTGLTRSILVRPQVDLRLQRRLNTELRLV